MLGVITDHRTDRLDASRGNRAFVEGPATDSRRSKGDRQKVAWERYRLLGLNRVTLATIATRVMDFGTWFPLSFSLLNRLPRFC